MSEYIKKYPKKFRKRETIMVDQQIALWRKKLKKKGLTTGKHVDKDRKASRKHTAKVREEKEIVVGKRNFFGVDEE
jgi:hypothetical protein